MDLVDVKIPQQRLEARQHPAGHQDPAVREHPVLDISRQPRHLFLIHQELEIPALPVIDGQPDGVGTHVHNPAFHGSAPFLLT